MIKIEKGLENCKIIKTVLMGFIVLYHSLIVFLQPSWGSVLITTPSRPLGLIAEFLSSFHIYAFTLISGYIFYYVKFEKTAIKGTVLFF